MTKDYTVVKTFYGRGIYANRRACVLAKQNEAGDIVYGTKQFLGPKQVRLDWYEGYYTLGRAEDKAEDYILGINRS